MQTIHHFHSEVKTNNPVSARSKQKSTGENISENMKKLARFEVD
jgi:hypothetical protein